MGYIFFCEGYWPSCLIEELGAYHPNHHMQILAKKSLVFIGGYKGQ
jgi:hypothetical protein